MNTTNGLYKTGLSRRSFFKAAGLSTAALLLPHFLTACGTAVQASEQTDVAGSAQEIGYGANLGTATWSLTYDDPTP